MLIGLFAGAILMRHTLVNLTPSFNAVFSLVGFRVDIPGDGLKIVSKKPSREKRDGKDVTIINGRIVNVSSDERKVPEIVISAIDSNGKTVSDTDVITEPSLVYFGYTFCPDVCPMDAIRNAEAVDVLEENGQMVTPVFISIDPKRDTPEVIGDYAEAVHPRMVGLTGSAEQVKAASRAYRTYYKAHDSSDEYYLVDHSTMTYLVLPEHGVVEFFRRDASPEAMAEKSACFIDKI